jgi:uncharacterized damage-inducible protein DinB
MLVEYPYSRNYLLNAIASGPSIASALLLGISQEEMDFRPDPDRFNLREVVAHLADWEPIWLERMTRIVNEENPILPNMDEGQMAIDRNYAESDLSIQLDRFQAGRVKVHEFLTQRTEEDWSREALRPEIGVVSLEFIACLLPVHDTYHFKQIIDYREAIKRVSAR